MSSWQFRPRERQPHGTSGLGYWASRSYPNHRCSPPVEGAWFRAGDGAGAPEIHVGVEDPFVPARKAHPALIVSDLDALAARLTEAALPVRWSQEIPGTTRFHTDDPFGNRLEFIDAGH
jgi:hypothetical protein